MTSGPFPVSDIVRHPSQPCEPARLKQITSPRPAPLGGVVPVANEPGVQSGGFVMNPLSQLGPPAWKCIVTFAFFWPGGMTEKAVAKEPAVIVAPPPAIVTVKSNFTGPSTTFSTGMQNVSARGFPIPPAMPPPFVSWALYAPIPSAPFGFGFAARLASKLSDQPAGPPTSVRPETAPTGTLK